MSVRQPVRLPLKQIKVPLELGWKRKLVAEAGKVNPTIHYINPDGTRTFTDRQQVKEYLEELQEQILDPDDEETERAPPLKATTLSPDWFIFSPAAILEKELEYESESGTRKVLARIPSAEIDVVCSRSCPGRGGFRPSLSCSTCLTYFHHRCVHVPETTEEFVCQGCVQSSSVQQRGKRRHIESLGKNQALPNKAVSNILSFLSETQDLLNASMVCKQWKSMSEAPSLWKHAALGRLTLTDRWSAFRTQFSSLVKLDTRGLCFSIHLNKSWEALAPILGSIATLKFITLGVVTGPVVALLLNSIKGVKHFEAQYIVHDTTRRYNDNKQVTEVELHTCAAQPHLRQLALCSPTSLKLSPDADLKLLRKLQRLQTLSITSFVPGALTSGGLAFISHLRNLSALQLGSCTDWQEAHFTILGNLTNLKHLRLESGPAEPSVGLSSALVKLHQLIQLELIVFPLHRTLNEAVSQLPKLNLLNLAPNAPNNEALASMNQILLTLMSSGKIWAGEWGAVISLNKNCHSNTQVIPVLRAYVADSVLYKAASRRGQGDVLMISLGEAKQLLSESIPENGIAAVYTVSRQTAHWLKMRATC